MQGGSLKYDQSVELICKSVVFGIPIGRFAVRANIPMGREL